MSEEIDMKNRKESIILLIVIVPLLLFGLSNVNLSRSGVLQDDIVETARESQHIDESFITTGDYTDNIGASLFYDPSHGKHTFSVYLRNEKSNRYSFSGGGSSSFIDRGIQGYYYENYGIVLFSMNKKRVVELRYLDQIVSIDENKPFVAVVPNNVRKIELYDRNGGLVRIDHIDISVAEHISHAENQVNEILNGGGISENPNLYLMYSEIFYRAIDEVSILKDNQLEIEFLHSTRPEELSKLQLLPLKVKAGFCLELVFEKEPIDYEISIWYDERTAEPALLYGDDIKVSKHRASEIYVVEAQYAEGLVNYVFEVEIDNHFEVIPNVVYHVLEEEYLMNDDPDSSQFTRIQWCYDGIKKEYYPLTTVVIIDKVENLNQARQVLNNQYPGSVPFEENTIVSNEVLEQWQDEGYTPSREYHENSLSGLTYEMVKEF